jgi:hypothetical protein
LCFFFTRYVLPQRDPQARRGFLEHVLPIYCKSEPNSPLQLSVMAVATCMLSGAMNQGEDPPLARSFYLSAVSGMKEIVSEQRGCANDELLMAVMLLQMYEVSCPLRYAQKTISPVSASHWKDEKDSLSSSPS